MWGDKTPGSLHDPLTLFGKKVDAPSCEEASLELPLWFMLILSRGKKPYITDHVFP
jgi:hypothetical protein